MRDEASQAISDLKSAFHTYRHQEIIHTSYVPILVDRLHLHYRHDKAKHDECDHWKDWFKAIFTHTTLRNHLATDWGCCWQDLSRGCQRLTFPVRFREHRGRAENIHCHLKHPFSLYKSRWGDDAKVVKILIEKLNDPEHINWTARFHKILTKLNMTFPVENIREFRFVLLNIFEAVRQDIKEIQTVLHFTLSGNSRARTSELTKREKTPKGKPPTGAPAKHCIVCGRYLPPQGE